jgi:hypothetical protein
VTLTKLAVFAFAAAFTAASVPAIAQQKPDATPASVASTTAITTTSSKPEADDTGDLIAAANTAAAANAKPAPSQMVAINKGVIEPTQKARKKAREFGFHEEIYDGKTFFCKDDATLGTRVPTKKCMDAMGFEDYSTQLEFARDTMHKDVCQGGGAGGLHMNPCGGVQ